MKKFIISLIFIILIGSSIIYNYGTSDSIVVRVQDKERVCSSNGDNTDCKYLIFTNKETFENTDSILRLKFRSSDIYGRIKIGELYRFNVYGLRVGFMSMYRNIITVTYIPKENTELK